MTQYQQTVYLTDGGKLAQALIRLLKKKKGVTVTS